MLSDLGLVLLLLSAAEWPPWKVKTCGLPLPLTQDFRLQKAIAPEKSGLYKSPANPTGAHALSHFNFS